MLSDLHRPNVTAGQVLNIRRPVTFAHANFQRHLGRRGKDGQDECINGAVSTCEPTMHQDWATTMQVSALKELENHTLQHMSPHRIRYASAIILHTRPGPDGSILAHLGRRAAMDGCSM